LPASSSTTISRKSTHGPCGTNKQTQTNNQAAGLAASLTMQPGEGTGGHHKQA
jgi:hypothetical protein